jgi:hypothetical protein
MSKSSTSVNKKALKLDNKVKAINHCDVGKTFEKNTDLPKSLPVLFLK